MMSTVKFDEKTTTSLLGYNRWGIMFV